MKERWLVRYRPLGPSVSFETLIPCTSVSLDNEHAIVDTEYGVVALSILAVVSITKGRDHERPVGSST